MRAWLLAGLLFLSLMLSGCVGGEDDAPDASGGTDDTGPGDGTGGTGSDGDDETNNTTVDPVPRGPSRSEQRTSISGLYPVPGVPAALPARVDARFDPATMTAPAGSIVNVTFTNSDRNNAMKHALVIDGFSSATTKDLGPTEKETLELLVDLAPGTYKFYCKNHPPGTGGIPEGTFTVTES